MFAGRTVAETGAVGGGATPDALVAAGAVAVLLRGRMVATRAVARRAAVFAMLFIVAMLVFAGRAVITAASVAHTSAVSAFRAHVAFLAFLSTARSIPQFRQVWRRKRNGAGESPVLHPCVLRIGNNHNNLKNNFEEVRGLTRPRIYSICLSLEELGMIVPLWISQWARAS